jgi:divalent metal cation (Fe/Co/Zn/Cd) transporter
MAGQADSLKSILFALFANSAIALAKDIAALFGLLFALLAIVATFLTGNPLWDAVGTIAIGALLIGQSVEPETLAEMEAFLRGRPEVEELYGPLTMQFGPDAMVAVKARMAPTGSELGMIEAINAVERAFRERFSGTAWLFFEPDVAD